VNSGDTIADQIEFRTPAADSLHKIEVIAPEGHWIIPALLQSISWFALPYCAEAVASQHGFSVEEAGFEYPTDLEPDEDSFEGVRLYAYDEEMFMSTAAFDRLMVRYFDKMTEIAEQRYPSVTVEAEWSDFPGYINIVRNRVAG
jgi:hypothetical protein